MVIRGVRAWGILAIGTVLVSVVVFGLGLLPGLGVETIAAFLPSSALSAKVGQPIAIYTADARAIDPAQFGDTIERFARDHDFAREQIPRVDFPLKQLADVRLVYFSKRATMSLISHGDVATLAIDSAPGVTPSQPDLLASAETTFQPLGFHQVAVHP